MSDSCSTCHYWNYEAGMGQGHCHRYPPTTLVDSDGELIFPWPVTNKDDVCGEYVKGEQPRGDKVRPRARRFGGNDTSDE